MLIAKQRFRNPFLLKGMIIWCCFRQLRTPAAGLKNPSDWWSELKIPERRTYTHSGIDNWRWEFLLRRRKCCRALIPYQGSKHEGEMKTKWRWEDFENCIVSLMDRLIRLHTVDSLNQALNGLVRITIKSLNGAQRYQNYSILSSIHIKGYATGIQIQSQPCTHMIPGPHMCCLAHH